MRTSKLFKTNLIGQIILFGMMALILSLFYGLTLQNRLTEEFVNRGTAISKSIANSSVELLLNRDASTIQATIDQFIDLESGVAYVFVVDDQEEFIAHTFVPGVPSEILEIRQGAKETVIVRDVVIPNEGVFIDITSPILAGVVGYVHIGMDKRVIQKNIWSAVINQIVLIIIIFLVAVVVVYIQTNRISRPLTQLTNYARQMASGVVTDHQALQFDPQLLSIAGREDEVGQLMSNFQHMVREIERREQNLAQQVTSLEFITTLSERLNAMLDLDQLAEEVVVQIKEKLEAYHAQIYLLDGEQERLVLSAATGVISGEWAADERPGILLDARVSIMARAAQTGQMIWVDNVQEVDYWLPDTLLPETASEIAVPITLGAAGQVVGVLDVQQDRIGAFDERDAALLRLSANHLAVAIRNARLFAEVEGQLAQAHALQQRYMERAWGQSKLAQHGDMQLHYRLREDIDLDEVDIMTARQAALQQHDLALVPLTNSAINEPDMLENSSQLHTLVTPISIQDLKIGHLQLHGFEPGRQWSENELAFIRAVVDQVAQTAENLRLFEETRERASREQSIREITDKLRAAPTLDMLLETAARELGQRLNIRHTILELGIDAETTKTASTINSMGNGHNQDQNHQP